MIEENAQKRTVAEINEARTAYEEARKALIRERDAYSELEAVLHRQTRDFLNDLRSFRMTISSEVQSLLRDMKDIRDFADSLGHSEALAKLRELCDVAERIKGISASGVLEAVNECALKIMDSK